MPYCVRRPQLDSKVRTWIPKFQRLERKKKKHQTSLTRHKGGPYSISCLRNRESAEDRKYSSWEWAAWFDTVEKLKPKREGDINKRGWVNYPDKLGLPQVLQKCVTANPSMDSMGFKIVPFPWGNPSHPLELAQQDGWHSIWKDQPHCRRGDCLWAQHCCQGECDGPLCSPIPPLLSISWLIPLQHCCTANMQAQDIT